MQWFAASMPSHAPANGHDFATNILQYHPRSVIRNQSFKLPVYRFWYRSEYIFNSNLPASEKQEVVDTILTKEGTAEPRKRVTLLE